MWGDFYKVWIFIIFLKRELYKVRNEIIIVSVVNILLGWCVLLILELRSELWIGI